ncbi:MAG: hypothetical protein FWB97_08360 [Oscillospiraceae bacterium]|nr:hypothetical protein [Oscillospiraceae bacterium]
MNEEVVKKRGWVKNAAIVFLAVMLVLTFFSNTILNLSLPEVAAQHATSGTIAARIRGTDTVRANHSHEVILNQTRTVREVHVRRGDEIEAGALLFTLADTESAELETAQTRLRQLEFELEMRLIEAGRGGGFEAEQRSIQLARDNLTQAQTELASIPYSTAGISAAQTVVDSTQVRRDSALATRDYLQNVVVFAGISEESAGLTLESAQNAYTPARTRVREAEAEVSAARLIADTRLGAVRDIQRELERLTTDTTELDMQIMDRRNQRAAAWIFHQANYYLFVNDARNHHGHPQDWAMREAIYLAAFALTLPENDPRLIAYTAITELDGIIADLERQRQERLGGTGADRNERIWALRNAEAELATAQMELRSAEAELASANVALATAEPSHTAAEAAHRGAAVDLAYARMELTAAQAALDEEDRALAVAEAELGVQERHREAWERQRDIVNDLQENLSNQVFMLSMAQSEAGVDGRVEALEMQRRRGEIDRERENIQRLEADAVGATITSPVSGIVSELNISSGEDTQAGRALAVVEVADRGYSLSLRVTLEQSRRVVIGDAAEATTGWWGGSDIHAILRAMRNDPESPATHRILDFEIFGDDVSSGDTVQITLGQRGENFEVIVPNSAIRSDANGDFVLVVLSRSTPLGNRFIATRADVNILATDDTHSAVAGGLVSWDFVITTATRPIEPGMQVRLIDNPW